ncbi:hypothetical protein ACIBU0_05075 [Streptomyces sp. NPDC049627]
MSDLKKLDALGYYCRKQESGGGAAVGGALGVLYFGWRCLRARTDAQ